MAKDPVGILLWFVNPLETRIDLAHHISFETPDVSMTTGTLLGTRSRCPAPKRRWPKVQAEEAERIRGHLEADRWQRAVMPPSVHRSETWRLDRPHATLTYWASSGTLYGTRSSRPDAAVYAAWAYIDSVAGEPFEPTERAVLFGMDESGSGGEVAGHVFLAGVLIPAALAKEVECIVGTARTKDPHKLGFWSGLAGQLETLRADDLLFEVESIAPEDFDPHRLHGLMDEAYLRILTTLTRGAKPTTWRVALDDYGAGGSMRAELDAWRDLPGAEVIRESEADDRYIEVRTASILAAGWRDRELQDINSNSEFRIGRGVSGNPQTEAWLAARKGEGREWPWFIRTRHEGVLKHERPRSW